ncbi:MAG: TraM recognition domain-containing protein [Phycisphaerae bacterium]|nr:MAG: hypothetical protein EDS66_14360 [Planctomycetota bacterium]MBE7456090.1 TraM recognition domain-containing protein [Planctomycetia bacterium]MCL4718606.1 TraM recognition domain-containing protein [Phycisphaerae bacterium]MCQ3921272.1 hypothetical protein [Planctomycetota bacterium]
MEWIGILSLVVLLLLCMRRLLRRGRRAESPAPDALSVPVVRWSADDAYTVRMATENTLVVGASGAGKTTGSGRALALGLLGNAKAGLLVCCAKSSEVELWEEYCAATGRTADLRVIRPGGPWRFNPVSYELAREGAVGAAENVVGLLEAILECADRQGDSGGARDDEAYWRRSTKQLVRNFVDLQILATGTVTIDALYRAVISAPQSLDEVRSEQWRNSSFCFKLLTEADKRTKSSSQEQDFALVADYVLCEFCTLSPKTRSVVVSCLTSQLDPMQRSVLRELFGTDTTLTPSDCENGAVIVCGLPTQVYRETGVIANAVLKYCWQRCMEGRRLDAASRAVFLWCDEFQTFVSSRDAAFLAACRSSRVGCVLLTQGVPGVYAALGGSDKGRAEADSIFGNCGLKVFHANSDPQTNEWASRLIGRTLQYRASGNHSHPADDQMSALLGLDWARENGTTSGGFSEVMEAEIEPREFTRLRTGGPDNGWIVDGIVFQNGRVFKASGRTWLPVQFNQRA